MSEHGEEDEQHRERALPCSAELEHIPCNHSLSSLSSLSLSLSLLIYYNWIGALQAVTAEKLCSPSIHSLHPLGGNHKWKKLIDS